MPYAKLGPLTQNLELHYEIHGSGKTKVLFIMGLLTDGSAWYRQTDFFIKHPDYQCVTYDNRGFGRTSSPLTFHYSTTQMAKDALALIDHLEWDKCHVVGTSMGGMIALELALIAPEKILSLSLLATHAGGLAGRAPLIGVRHMIQAILSRDENSAVENALSMLYSAKTLADTDKRKSLYDYHRQRYRKRLSQSLIGLIGQLTAVYRHYVSYADLLKIRYSPFQCLVMVGTEDRLVREANSYLIRRVLGCRLIKLDDAGHGILGESSDEINQELLNLFESNHKKEIPKEYPTEIQALDYCCQHRTHCFISDIVAFLKGLCLGLILYSSFSITGLTKNFYITLESVILLACLNGIRRSVLCIFNAFRARRFIRKHRLQLDRATHHGGIGIALPDEPKRGIPYGCGFEYPILPLIFLANIISIIYWIRISK